MGTDAQIKFLYYPLYMLIQFLNFVLRIFHFPILYRTPKIQKLFFMCKINFSYTQLSFLFFLRNIISFTMILMLFLLQKDFDMSQAFSAFFLFLNQKDFGTFHVFFFFDNTCLLLLYIENKFIKNIFICFKNKI